MSYEKILLTTDGSEEAEAAVDHALDIAERFEAELHVLFVVDIGVNTSYSAVEDLMSQLESSTKFEELGTEAIESVVEKADERRIEPVTAIEKGTPHQKIKTYSQENGIDMIVMSTHGRSGLDRMLLGSVTEKVLRSCPTPVLTVKRSQD